MADVELTGRFGGLYGALDWVIRLVAVNLLWIAGVIAGAIIAGVAPATVAAYWLLREYALGRRPQLWHDFWRQWKAELGPAQLRLGLPLATVVVIVFYLIAAMNQSAAIFRGVTLGLGLLLALYVATLLYVPAVFAHLDLRPVDAWRVSAGIAWGQPVVTILTLFSSAAAVVFMVFVAPGALPFFGLSLPALLATKAAQRSFHRAERQQ